MRDIVPIMKKDIHPEFNIKSKVKCACGASFEVGSTMSEIKVEICGECHPFYTGQEKVLDTAGRVEKFKQRREAAKNTVKNKSKSLKIKNTKTKTLETTK